MSDARTAILSAIRASLGRGELAANAVADLERGMRETGTRIQPRVDGDLVEHFAARAQSLAATIARVARRDEVPAAVVDYLKQRGLSTALVAAGALKDLAWPPEVQVQQRATARTDPVSVTACFAAIAETGSLVMRSGPDSPTTLNFTPDDMVAVLDAGDIVAHAEDVWRRLRKDPMPRTVNLISGPSRTADIEQVVQLGVHGPRRVHVILVGSAA